MGEKTLSISFFCGICSSFEGRGRYSPRAPTQHPHCWFFGFFCPVCHTHHAVSHQGSLCKARQHVGGVMLVVRHTGQAGVKCHHDEGELEEGTEQAGSLPRESGLQIKLPGKRGKQKKRFH